MADSAARQPGRTRRFDSLEQEAFLNLWRTYDRLHAIEEALFAGYDLSPQQYNALRLLRDRAAHGGDPTLPTLSLAGKLVSRAPDITRMLDKLESRGLVSRERPVDNRRVVLISITPAGQSLLAELDEQVRASHQKQLGHMPAAELKQLVDLLHKVRAPHEEPGSPWRT